MHLSDEIQQKIHSAHFVRGIKPTDYLVKYKNIFELLGYRAHLHSDDIFITFYPDNGPKISFTYNEFTDRVCRTANLLVSNGIQKNDRIATVSHNHINTVIQYFAAWAIGAAVVPINVNEEKERIKYILISSGTQLAFVHDNYLNTIVPFKTNIPSFKRIIPHSVFQEEIKKQSSEFTAEDINQETEALLVYTSGTTGLPKGVVLTQYNLMVDADGISKWHKLEKGQTMMCVLPIHHVNGTVVTLMTPMYYGGKVVLCQKFHIDNFFKILRGENVQVVSVVPTLLQYLCHETNSVIPSEAKNLKNFRHIICGAGPLTCELALKFENMFDLKIIHGYGLSETTCYSCFLPADLPDNEHRKWLSEFGFPSIGLEIEPNEMDIQNEKSESVKEGERGEIVIRGHNVMKYYDENPEANAKTFEFGWFRSGDEGFYRKDNSGRNFFFITGRIKELIIRGGVNIAPLEIDEVLMSIPEVKAGISVGFDNDWYGEEVGAYVQLKDDCNITEQQIIDFCSGSLPFYKTPKVVIFGSEIPVTSTGKYQRNKLKHLFTQYKTIQFKKD
jgi:acyl-CoA synthetase (AMP-forming)/AMP-acid ligase II